MADDGPTLVLAPVVPGDDDPTWMRSAATPRPWEPMGAVVGHYQIVARLGATPLAEIFLGQHVDPGARREAIIKVLRDDAAADPWRAAGVRAAMRALAGVNHPDVVEVLYVTETSDGRPCISLDLRREESLRGLLDRAGPMPRSLAAVLVAELGAAVAAVHAAGLVIGDLGAERVLVRRDGDVLRLRLTTIGAATLDLDPTDDRTLARERDLDALHALADEMTADAAASDRTVIVARAARWPVLAAVVITAAILTAAIIAGWR